MTELENVEQKVPMTLAKQTSEKMLEYIAKHRLVPGDRLGTEREMAEELDVGRSTVREAINILVSRNILEVKQGSGTYLSQMRGIADDPLGLELIHDQFKLTWDLLEFRIMIEPQIAAMAAANARRDQILEMERLCDQMEVFDDNDLERLYPDTRFHICIAEASGNLVAPNLIPIINKAVELFIHYTKREKTPETVATHREILEGIRRRDASWAQDMMHMHLMFNRQELRRAAMRQGISFINGQQII